MWPRPSKATLPPPEPIVRMAPKRPPRRRTTTWVRSTRLPPGAPVPRAVVQATSALLARSTITVASNTIETFVVCRSICARPNCSPRRRTATLTPLWVVHATNAVPSSASATELEQPAAHPLRAAEPTARVADRDKDLAIALGDPRGDRLTATVDGYLGHALVGQPRGTGRAAERHRCGPAGRAGRGWREQGRRREHRQHPAHSVRHAGRIRGGFRRGHAQTILLSNLEYSQDRRRRTRGGKQRTASSTTTPKWPADDADLKPHTKGRPAGHATAESTTCSECELCAR